MELVDVDCDCSSKHSPTGHTRYISAEQVTTKVSSTVHPNPSLMQPKIEVNLFPEDDLNLGSFQQLETQLLDTMEICEQQPSHSHKIEVFGDDDMLEPGNSMIVPPPGSKDSTCLDDMLSKRVEGHPCTDIHIDGRSSVANNVSDAPIERQGTHIRLKHADRLRKYLKEHGKIPVVFCKEDGRPVGKYASMFVTELGIAVKKLAPLQVSGWNDVTEEQKQPIFSRLESAFKVDFSRGRRSFKTQIDKLMSKRYRDYRMTMHRHYKTLVHLPWEERLKHTPKEYCRSEADWEFMCKMFESETFKKASVINSGNQAKIKPTFIYRGGRKSWSQYKYEVDDESGEKDGIADSNVTNSSDKDCPGESTDTAKNDDQIGLANQDDGSRQFIKEVNVAAQACDQVRSGYIARHKDDIQPDGSHQFIKEVNVAAQACDQVCSGYIARHKYDIQPAKSTSFDATSLIAANADLRNELHSTRTALQLAEDKIRTLEANQKRLEEKVQANTQIMEAHQRMMKQVFEKLASDIAQSLPSSAPPPPPP